MRTIPALLVLALSLSPLSAATGSTPRPEDRKLANRVAAFRRVAAFLERTLHP